MIRCIICGEVINIFDEFMITSQGAKHLRCTSKKEIWQSYNQNGGDIMVNPNREEELARSDKIISYSDLENISRNLRSRIIKERLERIKKFMESQDETLFEVCTDTEALVFIESASKEKELSSLWEKVDNYLYSRCFKKGGMVSLSGYEEGKLRDMMRLIRRQQLVLREEII